MQLTSRVLKTLSLRVVALALLGTLAACAARTPPPLPAALAYPQFMYPSVTAGASGDTAAIDRGWRFLQSKDLASADREFTSALRQTPGFHPARTGRGYVELAAEDFTEALAEFDVALKGLPAYVPALVGRGQALLGLKREDAAAEAFEAALAADASLTDLRRTVEVLRFRGLQGLIEQARAAAAAGQLDAAAASYGRALAASPDTGFLHRELGIVARRQGNADAALGNFRRASELDPGDTAALVQIGELLEARQDFAGAEAAFRRAAEIDGGPELTARAAAAAERARDAALPPAFSAIPAASQVSRGDLAALIGVRLEDFVRQQPPREVVITDGAGHWASSWITQVARAGIMDPFANHTFQPASAITRADLASAVSRVVGLLAPRRPELRPHLTARPAIADMNEAHLSYPAAATAVASGILPLQPGGRFEVARSVTGVEAVDVVSRLRTLVLAAR